MEFNSDLSQCPKLKSKWIKDPKVRAETLILLEDKIDETLEDVGLDKDSLNITLVAE